MAMTQEEVRQARVYLGLTQEEMATRLGVSERTYRRWETTDLITETGALLLAKLVEEEG